MTLSEEALAAHDAELAAEVEAGKARKDRHVKDAKQTLGEVLAVDGKPRPQTGMRQVHHEVPSLDTTLVVLAVDDLVFAVRTRDGEARPEVTLVRNDDGWTPVGAVRSLAGLGRLLRERGDI